MPLITPHFETRYIGWNNSFVVSRRAWKELHRLTTVRLVPSSTPLTYIDCNTAANQYTAGDTSLRKTAKKGRPVSKA